VKPLTLQGDTALVSRVKIFEYIISIPIFLLYAVLSFVGIKAAKDEQDEKSFDGKDTEL